MAKLRQRTVHDAGASKPTNIEEINDQGGRYASTPRSSFAINESVELVFTNKIVEQAGGQKYNPIADGAQRPGTAA